MEKINIVGCNICNITMSEGKSIVNEFLNQDKIKTIYTPNSEMLMMAIRDSEFATVLNQGDLVIPDGIGVVIASKFYRTPLKEKVGGCDLMGQMLELANQRGSSVYFLGAKPGVAETAKEKILLTFPNIVFRGVRDGYFEPEDLDEIIEDINKQEVDLLFLALGVPRQEKLIHDNKHRLRVKVAMGVGGSLDVFAGVVKRAPEIYQKLGLEWFYRLLKQPSRFVRMLDLPRFIGVAFYDAMFTRK